MTERKRGRIIELAPIGGDGLCTGCGARPTRETGRCKCYSGPATVVAPAVPALDVERLKRAMLNAWPYDTDIGVDPRLIDGTVLDIAREYAALRSKEPTDWTDPKG